MSVLCPIDWLTDWLIDWLIDWKIKRHVCFSALNFEILHHINLWWFRIDFPGVDFRIWQHQPTPPLHLVHLLQCHLNALLSVQRPATVLHFHFIVQFTVDDRSLSTKAHAQPLFANKEPKIHFNITTERSVWKMSQSNLNQSLDRSINQSIDRSKVQVTPIPDVPSARYAQWYQRF